MMENQVEILYKSRNINSTNDEMSPVDFEIYFMSGLWKKQHSKKLLKRRRQSILYDPPKIVMTYDYRTHGFKPCKSYIFVNLFRSREACPNSRNSSCIKNFLWHRIPESDFDILSINSQINQNSCLPVS